MVQNKATFQQGIKLSRFLYKDNKVKEPAASNNFEVTHNVNVITPIGKIEEQEFTVKEFGDPNLTFARHITTETLQAEENRIDDEWFKIQGNPAELYNAKNKFKIKELERDRKLIITLK